MGPVPPVAQPPEAQHQLQVMFGGPFYIITLIKQQIAVVTPL